MGNLSKKSKSIFVLDLIVCLLFSVCFFLVPFKKDASTIISFFFGITSIIYSGYIIEKVVNYDGPLKSKFYGFPLIKVAYLYVIAQVVFSLIIFIVSFFLKVPVWIPIVISIVLLGCAIMGSIIMEEVKEVIQEVERTVVVDTKNMTELKSLASSVLSVYQNKELLKPLEKLSEEFKYSDPVSTDQSKPLEEELRTKLNQLYGTVNNDESEVTELIQTINRLLVERNRVCKETKK